VPGAELAHGLRHLFRRRNADVGECAAVQRFWVIQIDDVFHEIGAVARNGMKVRNVRGRIQLFDEREVLLPSRLDLKTVNRAIVRRADQLVPISGGRLAVSNIRSDYLQMLAAVAVPQKRSHFRIGE